MNSSETMCSLGTTCRKKLKNELSQNTLCFTSSKKNHIFSGCFLSPKNRTKGYASFCSRKYVFYIAGKGESL